MKEIYDNVSFATSKIVTLRYSTSFSIGVKCLGHLIQPAIYSIYGFVRLVDETVDTFHEFDKEYLLNKFESDYHEALKLGISLNPILNSFQLTVKKYNIDPDLIDAFFKSMRSDLNQKEFNDKEINEYIYGSAEVVGLMCLKVFVNGDDSKFENLKPYAMRLGAAFQKINFLRDLKYDTLNLSRTYFPILKHETFDENSKQKIMKDIYDDFKEAIIGIQQLPENSRLGVYTAYLYYKKLAKKIEKTDAEQIMKTRIRISNPTKIRLFCNAYLRNKLNKLW